MILKKQPFSPTKRFIRGIASPSQGLTQAGAALIALAVAAVTAGTFSSLSASMAEGIGLGGSAAVEGAFQAGLTSIAVQTTTALINNQGDLGAALASLGSSDGLRSLVTAMVTAGLTAGLTDGLQLHTELPTTAPLTDRIVQDIQQGLIKASVRAGISTAISGGKLGDNLISALRVEAASVIGENVAQEIGKAVDAQDMNTASQLIAHAALGCVTGAVASGDCGSGALGGVVGETVGLVTKARLAVWLKDRIGDIEQLSYIFLMDKVFILPNFRRQKNLT